MNYRVQLVTGPDVGFFLEEWEPGGIVISDGAVGLFPAGSHEKQLGERLATYGLTKVTLHLNAHLKVGFSREWTWRRVRWTTEQGSPALFEAMRRIEAVLGPGLHRDSERRVELLRLVQHAVKRYGAPAIIEGEIARVHGRKDRIAVYRTGIVAYDRTPHPLPFLREVVQVAAAGPA